MMRSVIVIFNKWIYVCMYDISNKPFDFGSDRYADHNPDTVICNGIFAVVGSGKCENFAG